VLDKETALTAANALGTVMAALLEDSHEAATVTSDDMADYSHRVELIRQLAEDSIVLVAATLVLARRCAE
jgi:hypothetical protein